MILAVFFFSILAVPFFISPESSFLPKCYFKSFTGYSCPSCGFSRSFFAVSHLDIKEAFIMHAIAPVVYLSMLLYVLSAVFETISGSQIKLELKSYSKKGLLFSFFSLWIVFWLVRLIIEILN